MTHSASHVMEVMLLARLVGLCGTTGRDWFCRILVAPLFETVDDLQRKPGDSRGSYCPTRSIARWWRPTATTRKSCWLFRLVQGRRHSGVRTESLSGQLSIIALTQQFGVGIAGCPWPRRYRRRGGGPTYEAILSQPPGTGERRNQSSPDQGEMLYYKIRPS